MVNFSVSVWNIDRLMDLLGDLKPRMGCMRLFLFVSQTILYPFQNISLSMELVL